MKENCVLYQTSEILGKKWTLPIILELYKGKNKLKRYSHLKKQIPNITAKILSLRLKELEKEKIITKKIDSSSYPIKVNYSLTKSGKEFIKILDEIKKWALKNKYPNISCKNKNCESCQD